MGYQSTRYLVIRDAIYDALWGDEILSAEVKGWAKDEQAFASLGSTQFPAAAVLFAVQMGEQQAKWASGGYDHAYEFEVRVAAESFDHASAQDGSIAYMERAEDALRADATLGGLVRSMQCRIARLSSEQRQKRWRSTVALQVRVEKRV